VLEHGQVIGIFSRLIQEPLHQSRVHDCALLLQRPFDCFLLLQTSQTRDKIIAVVQRFGQAEKLATLTKIVRSHGEQNVDWDLALLDRVQKQVNEKRSCVAAVLSECLVAVPEDLFKLIHD